MARRSKGTEKASAGHSRLGLLIEQLGPLNNRWRESTARERVLALWDMGDVILASAHAPSDALLWDIQEKSYITRNILRYALIVRRGWSRRADLESLVRSLRSFTVFREALPFLKGDRERIDHDTYSRVIAVLGDPDTTKVVRFLKKLKAEQIGRQHKKGVSVQGTREHAVSFEQALSRVEAEVLQASPPSEQDQSVLLALSQVAVAFATGESMRDVPTALHNVSGDLAGLADPMLVTLKGGRAAVAAFRRLVGGERLIQAADLLNSMRTETTLRDWRRRHGGPVRPAPSQDGRRES